MDLDSDASNRDFLFTDIDLEPITCDINAAHFDGFLYEIADYCTRTAKFPTSSYSGYNHPWIPDCS